MVHDLWEATGRSTELARRSLPVLLREHSCWTSGPKAVALAPAAADDGRPAAASQLQGSLPPSLTASAHPGHERDAPHRLSRYWAAWSQPRPESYRYVGHRPTIRWTGGGLTGTWACMHGDVP